MKYLVLMFTLVGFSQMATAGLLRKSPLAKTSKTYVSKQESKKIYRADITVFDDRSIKVDLDQFRIALPMGSRFDRRPVAIRENVMIMDSMLTRMEMNEIVDLLIELSGAEVKQVVSPMVCAMVPPIYATRSPLSIVGDYNYRRGRFYKSISEVFSDSGCWESHKTFLAEQEDQKLAYELIAKITKVVDSMMKKYTEK